MANKRIMITLSEKAMEELEKLCEKKQMSKSVVIALAIEKMIKEENRDGE
jgi:metal-responsive CopG/Arc/MetJ family transcriptional regulator